MAATVKFRSDINALRALAVAAVVLYHYKTSFIPGGYVGVDVFFVISGYLMTNIIVGRLEKGVFSLWGFYYDRVKRIVPGLIGLCFCLLAAGFLFLDPVNYRYLAYTSVSALLFFSNFRFAEAIGYFDPQSETKWLLHTWSLSVEWQFYLLYPVILFALHKFAPTRRHLGQILWAMALASIALCVWASRADPASAFYLLPQRAWEMLAGGIVALQFKTCPQKYSTAILTGGISLIAFSIFFFDRKTLWPYFWALLPVTGACLVIAANRSDSIAFKSGLVQLIGKWSYSIYLWHWPIAVTALYFGVTKTNAAVIISELLILAAIISAGGLILFLTRKASIERLVPALRAWPQIAPISGALAATIALALVITTNKGLPERHAESAKQLEIYRKVVSDWDYPPACDGMDSVGNLRPCEIGESKKGRVLVIGDSFAMQAFNRYVDAGRVGSEASLTFLASSGCPPVTGIEFVSDRFHCNGFFDKALSFAENGDFKRIVLISTWYGYFSLGNSAICFLEGGACIFSEEPAWFSQHVDATLAAMRARLLAFRKRGIEIVIVSATPYGDWDVPTELLKRQFLGISTKEIEFISRDDFERGIAPLKEKLISLAASVGGTFVDPLDFLCEDRRCATIDENAVPLYRDKGHFRAGAVRTARFGFLDDALGAHAQYSAIAGP